MGKKSKTPNPAKKKPANRTAARLFEELGKIRSGQRQLNKRIDKLTAGAKPARRVNVLHDALGMDEEE